MAKKKPVRKASKAQAPSKAAKPQNTQGQDEPDTSGILVPDFEYGCCTDCYRLSDECTCDPEL